MSLLETQENTAQNEHLQHLAQQSFGKWSVSRVDSIGQNVPLPPHQLASLIPLLDSWDGMSLNDRDSLIAFARSLSQSEVTE